LLDSLLQEITMFQRFPEGFINFWGVNNIEILLVKL